MKKLTTEEFILKATKIHSGIFNYNNVIIKDYYNDKIEISCVHGVFKQLPNDHIRGIGGCMKCSIYKKEKLESKITKLKSKLFKTHKDKYQFDFSNFKNNLSKIKATCNLHGDFLITAKHLLRGQGCKQCGYESNKNNTEYFIKKGKEQHYDKYCYSAVTYVHSDIPVKIICPKHGLFLQKPSSHLRKRGCPRCKESKGELQISNWLNNKNIIFEREKSFPDCKNINCLEFDFYLPVQNVLIEYDGLQHFKPIRRWGGEKTYLKTIKSDEIKNQYCKNKKMCLLRIRFDDNIEERLSQILKNKM